MRLSGNLVTINEKIPLSSVEVPAIVLFIYTLAKGTVAPDLSVIFPFRVNDCACPMPYKANKKASKAKRVKLFFDAKYNMIKLILKKR